MNVGKNFKLFPVKFFYSVAFIEDGSTHIPNNYIITYTAGDVPQTLPRVRKWYFRMLSLTQNRNPTCLISVLFWVMKIIFHFLILMLKM